MDSRIINSSIWRNRLAVLSLSAHNVDTVNEESKDTQNSTQANSAQASAQTVDTSECSNAQVWFLPTPIAFKYEQFFPIHGKIAQTYQAMKATSSSTTSLSARDTLALAQPVSPALTPLLPALQKRSQQVDYLFEEGLSTLSNLNLSNTLHTPSLFLVYAHDNPVYGQAEAVTARYFIEKLSMIRVQLYSDQTPMGKPYSSLPEALKRDGKLEDILTSQLCLLPSQLIKEVKPVDKVAVCCSEVLGNYLQWSHYDDFYRELRAAYEADVGCVQQSEQKQSIPAIREVVRKFSQTAEYQAGFHHVLTEMAFLQIRAERLNNLY